MDTTPTQTTPVFLANQDAEFVVQQLTVLHVWLCQLPILTDHVPAQMKPTSQSQLMESGIVLLADQTASLVLTQPLAQLAKPHTPSLLTKSASVLPNTTLMLPPTPAILAWSDAINAQETQPTAKVVSSSTTKSSQQEPEEPTNLPSSKKDSTSTSPSPMLSSPSNTPETLPLIKVSTLSSEPINTPTHMIPPLDVAPLHVPPKLVLMFKSTLQSASTATPTQA